MSESRGPESWQRIPCPSCGHRHSRVLDSRGSKKALEAGARRRRQCDACGRRYTTRERIDPAEAPSLDAVRQLMAEALTILRVLAPTITSADTPKRA